MQYESTRIGHRWLGISENVEPGHLQRTFIRIFAIVVPAVFYAVYFAVPATDGIGWPVELWTGSIVLAAVVGLFLTLLVSRGRGTPRITPQEVQHLMVQQMPNASLQTFEGVGHNMKVEIPDLLAGSVRDFVGKIEFG